MNNTEVQRSSAQHQVFDTARHLARRNIYLRQELCKVAKGIQEKSNEPLALLDLVSTAAYEQVFNRQPLSSPEKIVQEAIEHGTNFYQIHREHLKEAEKTNCFDPRKTSAKHAFSFEQRRNFSTIENSSRQDSVESTVSTGVFQQSSRFNPPKIIIRRPSNSSVDEQSIAARKKSKKRKNERR